MVQTPYRDEHKAVIEGVRNLIDDNTTNGFVIDALEVFGNHIRVAFKGRVPVALISAINRSDALSMGNIYPIGARKGHIYIRYT